MTYLGYVLKRALFAVLSAYAVVTLAFLAGIASLQNDIQNALGYARYFGATEVELARLEQSLTSTFGFDQPLPDRLIAWWVDVTTFDWGYSTTFERPVTAVLDDRVWTTLEYVVPALLLAIVFGVLVGVYVALNRNGVVDWTVRLGAYFLLGIPAFMLATYAVYLGGTQIPLVDGWVLELYHLDDTTVAAVAVAAAMVAGQLRFARASALEQTGAAFMKMLRAKGAGRLRLARHVLRNAAVPIVSLSITELLAVLVLNIYVIERVLSIHGLASVSLRAIGVVEGGGFGSPPVLADLSLLIWSTMVIVCIGITLSFLQDVLKGYLDPRIGAE